MTDRELLELAARAVGYTIHQNGTDVNGIPWYWCDQLSDAWDPLIDDGDALRLAVALKMEVRCKPYDDEDEVVDASTDTRMVEESIGDDRLAATRRAIVRAAAEIGKGMK